MLTTSLIILAMTTITVFIAGLVTRNYSHVDRLWSLLPPFYAILWFFKFGFSPVYSVIALPVILWGARLTWNFNRRGGYAFNWKQGFYGEDYRWEIMRQKIPNRFLFELFNLGFISIVQIGLIFLFTLPIYFAGMTGGPVTPGHMILAGLFLLLLTGETIADNQQYAYQENKHSDTAKKDVRMQLGFNTYGLWRFSRHPNYFCEMGQWVVVWAYAALTLHTIHWTGIGASILILLFIGSTIMAESITASKYPDYAAWKKATPPWIPFIDFPLRQSSRKGFWKMLKDRS